MNVFLGIFLKKVIFKDLMISLDIKRNISHVYTGKRMKQKQLPAGVLQNFLAFLNVS